MCVGSRGIKISRKRPRAAGSDDAPVAPTGNGVSRRSDWANASDASDIGTGSRGFAELVSRVTQSEFADDELSGDGGFVEQIRGERRIRNDESEEFGLEYLVRWKDCGPDEDTWMPSVELMKCDEVREEYVLFKHDRRLKSEVEAKKRRRLRSNSLWRLRR